MRKALLLISLMMLIASVSIVSADTCTDSGDNFYGKDVVIINKTDGTSFIREDTCLEDGRVQEITCCDCENYAGCKNTCAKYMQCPNGCSAGACIQSNTTAPVCQPINCSGGTATECKIVNNECICSTCPPVPACRNLYYYDESGGMTGCDYKQFCGMYMYQGLHTFESKEECYNSFNAWKEKTMPTDMDSCLNNPDYYWDQRTNSCLIAYAGCIDPDGGKNIFEQAHTFGLRSSYADSKDKRIITGGKDSCISDKQIIEHYCENNFIQTAYLDCPNGCSNGACVKGEPIAEKITCKFEGTNQKQECYLAGQFTDADLGTKFCYADAGSSSCVITYTSYAGEQVTWKSSCGQYQYTTQDGIDEVIYFKCEIGEIKIEEIKNKGFTKVYFQCYDGEESKSANREACKSADYWKKFASNFCASRCENDPIKCKQKYKSQEEIDKCLGKCGINSFSIGDECYFEPASCPMPSCGDTYPTGEVDNNGCPVITCGKCQVDSDCPVVYKSNLKCINGKCVTQEVNCVKEGESTNALENRKCCDGLTSVILSKSTFKCVKEEITVCKDSCPLDGKCYPFGYRKAEKYCSDSGGFVVQKKNEACDNSFECSSNVCVNNECVSQGFIEKIISWFKRLFGGEEEKPKYTCPTAKTIDCMPQVGAKQKDYCQKDYRAWIEKNCDVQFVE